VVLVLKLFLFHFGVVLFLLFRFWEGSMQQIHFVAFPGLEFFVNTNLNFGNRIECQKIGISC
jgi:hypothetical protein